MAARSPFTPERVAAVTVDAELLLLALEDVADAHAERPRKDPDFTVICAKAYVEFIGLDAKPGTDALSENDILVIAALASRMAALSEVLEQRALAKAHTNPEHGPFSRLAIIEAACTATLIRKDGLPRFQVLDFLARAGQAAKDTAP